VRLLILIYLDVLARLTLSRTRVLIVATVTLHIGYQLYPRSSDITICRPSTKTMVSDLGPSQLASFLSISSLTSVLEQTANETCGELFLTP